MTAHSKVPIAWCYARAAFFWGWRFQQFSHGPKRALYGWSLPVAKACGNAMKIVIWPVLILPLSYVFTTPLRCSIIDIQQWSLHVTTYATKTVRAYALLCAQAPCLFRNLHSECVI